MPSIQKQEVQSQGLYKICLWMTKRMRQKLLICLPTEQGPGSWSRSEIDYLPTLFCMMRYVPVNKGRHGSQGNCNESFLFSPSTHF